VLFDEGHDILKTASRSWSLGGSSPKVPYQIPVVRQASNL